MFLDISNELNQHALRVEAALEKYFPADDSMGGLTEAMKYSVLGGGKRIRAFLTLTFAKMYGADEESAMPFACALEMIHAYSLVHDDMPCMDDDDMRRGKPSCHKRFGEATALLAGDSLLTYAFEVCASNTYVSPASVTLAVKTLANLAGFAGMCGGQEIDLCESAESYERLTKLHLLKTGALIKAACLLGLYAATDHPDPEDVKNISEYADTLGIAFQIRDDILDVTSDSETLGKPVGSDEKNDKKTVLSFMSLDEAMVLERELTAKAIAAVSACPNGEIPKELALWLLARKK